MKEKSKRWTPFRIVVLILIGLSATVLLFLGCLALLGGAIFTVCFVLLYFIFPITLFLCVFFLLRSRMRAAWKVLLCFFLVVVFLVFSFGLFLLGHYIYDFEDTGEEAVEIYQTIRRKNSAFPEVSQLGDYQEIAYHEFIDQFGSFFTAENHILICTYSEDAYNQQKALLDANYVFQTSPMDTGIDPTITLDGYHFRMLSIAEDGPYNLEYPKYLFFVVTNDENHEIAYHYFSDPDLDDISSLEEFILRDCGWKYVNRVAGGNR